MTGHPAAEILALWAGGDIDGDVRAELGLHLESCAECRRNVDEIRRTREILAASFEEPSETDLRQLRIGLLRSIEKRRRTARWCWSLAGAVAVLALVTMPTTHRTAPISPVAERNIQLPAFPASVHLALTLPEKKRIPAKPASRADLEQQTGLRAVNFVPGANGSTQLRLTTADPNVIILLTETESRVEQ